MHLCLSFPSVLHIHRGLLCLDVWVQAMTYHNRQEAWAKDTHEVCVMHTWFFFELITKSIAQHASIMKAAGKPTIDKDFVQELRTLLLNMVNMVVVREVDSTKCAPRLLSAIAFFLRDMLSYVPRCDVFAITHDVFKLLHMDVLIGDAVGPDERACYRLDMLEILCSHEHYVAFNLPFEQAEDSAFPEISLEYLDQHYLTGYVPYTDVYLHACGCVDVPVVVLSMACHEEFRLSCHVLTLLGSHFCRL